MQRLMLLSVAALVLSAASLPAQSEVGADEKTLKGAYQEVDGKSLIAFLRTRAKGKAEPKTIKQLIEQLDSKDADERQKASKQLVAIGAPALPRLRLEARDSGDAAERAKRLVKILEDEVGVTGAAVRLIAYLKPAGAAEALLDYLPHAENRAEMEEIKAALADVAYVREGKDRGKPEPAMLAALDDPHPLRRANAVVALCAGGRAEPRAALRKLLTDKSATVRFRAAMALAGAGDVKAVSTLVTLLGDLPREQAGEVEGFLLELAGDEAPKVTLGDDEVSRQKARDAWAKWYLDSDGPELMKGLEKRTLTEEKVKKANALLEKLCDDSFEVRQQVRADLKKMGPCIMPLLRAAQKHQDLGVRKGALDVLKALETEDRQLGTVLRLIALRKPRGAAEALLAYVASAEDETLLEEAQKTLNAVTFPTGKADPAVVKALVDKVAARRAAAAVALLSGPAGEYAKDVRQLLDPKTEKDGKVRLRVALALAATGEKEAVPALIQLIEELPADQSGPAEDFLMRLSRDTPPKDLPEGNGDKDRKERAAAWRKWWEANQKTITMPTAHAIEFRPRYAGNVLLVLTKNNQVMELDRNNKTLLTISGLKDPWDAQFLGSNKILIAEYDAMKVTERDFRGKVLWEKTNLGFYPMQAERLRNGDTFIVGHNKLVQVNKAGREVFRIDRPNHDVRTARRLANGQVVLLTNRDQYVLLNRAGKEIKRTQLPQAHYQNEILDNGNVLVPLKDNEVAEYNPDGKVVWSVKEIERPLHAVRLPDGHTLITMAAWPYKFVEFDRKGKKVREHVTNVYAHRIRAR